jgi:hypothetical protein
LELFSTSDKILKLDEVHKCVLKIYKCVCLYCRVRNVPMSREAQERVPVAQVDLVGCQVCQAAQENPKGHQEDLLVHEESRVRKEA